MMIVAAASLCMVVKRSDIVFAVATGPHILEPVRIPVLLLNHLTEILGAIVHLARFVDANILGASRPAADRSSELRSAYLPVRAYSVANAAGHGFGWG